MESKEDDKMLNRQSVSSIEKIEEEEENLLEAFEDELFLQCFSISKKNGLMQSDKSTLCSTQSSFVASCDFANSPVPNDDIYVTFDCSDEKKKQPDSDEEAEESGYSEHLMNLENENSVVTKQKKNICHDIEKQKDKKNSFSQIFCVRTCLLNNFENIGVLLFLNGTLLVFGSWSISLVTHPETWKYVVGQPISIHLSCSMMIACGLLAFITRFLEKRKPFKKQTILIVLVLLLSLICTAFCVTSLVYLITVIHSSLDQLNACVFNDFKQMCSCYGPNRKLIKFAENMACGAVKKKLKELAYGVSVLFGIGCLFSLATALSALFLLFKRGKRRCNVSGRTSFQDACDSPNDEESAFSATQHCEKEQNTKTQPPQRPKRKIRRGSKSYTTRENGAKISSVATQTPSFMMNVYDIIDPNENDGRDEDTCSELSLESPPSYSEAVKVLEQKKWKN